MSEPSNSNDPVLVVSASLQEPHEVVAKLRNLLGQDVVLLPVIRGQKAPSLTSWQRTSVADMDSPEYLLSLSQGNIGVLLGEASGNICTVDIDDDAAVEPFLELNPTLRYTLGRV